jgi:hypothetical protein
VKEGRRDELETMDGWIVTNRFDSKGTAKRKENSESRSELVSAKLAGLLREMMIPMQTEAVEECNRHASCFQQESAFGKVLAVPWLRLSSPAQ